MKLLASAAAIGSLALWLTACAPGDGVQAPEQSETANQLTTFELEHGVGPFTEAAVLPPEVDYELAAEGQAVFEMNCEVCHQWEGRLVGPPLGEVLARRSPTFILNMIMNPEQMAREHPEGQAMLAQYPVVMPHQNITEEQAHAILEYLRTEER